MLSPFCMRRSLPRRQPTRTLQTSDCVTSHALSGTVFCDNLVWKPNLFTNFPDHIPCLLLSKSITSLCLCLSFSAKWLGSTCYTIPGACCPCSDYIGGTGFVDCVGFGRGRCQCRSGSMQLDRLTCKLSEYPWSGAQAQCESVPQECSKKRETDTLFTLVILMFSTLRQRPTPGNCARFRCKNDQRRHSMPDRATFLQLILKSKGNRPTKQPKGIQRKLQKYLSCPQCKGQHA